MRIVKGAAVQLRPVLYRREGTVDKVVRKIHELGRETEMFFSASSYALPGGRHVNRHHRGGHSCKHARPRRIEDRALADGQRSPSLDDLANSDQSVRPGRLQKVDLELHGQHFSICRHDR